MAERGRTAGPAEVYPDARPAGVSTGNQRLLDLNNRFSGLRPFRQNASTPNMARLLGLETIGWLSAGQHPNHDYRSPRDARLLELNR